MNVNASKPELNQDLVVVDTYLEKWDKFAQGENSLISFIRDNEQVFKTSLTRLLKANDKRAPARMVFYPVVQVGGAILVDSELGEACARVVGSDVPVTTTDERKRVYFSGDLYLWWEANRSNFETYPLFDEWSQRDFAKTVVIPMLKSASGRR